MEFEIEMDGKKRIFEVTTHLKRWFFSMKDKLVFEGMFLMDLQDYVS